jgi:hypothetical protein
MVLGEVMAVQGLTASSNYFCLQMDLPTVVSLSSVVIFMKSAYSK